MLDEDIAFCRRQIANAEARAASAPTPEAGLHHAELARLYRVQLASLARLRNAVPSEQPISHFRELTAG